MAKRKQDGYGRMCGMTGRGEIRHLQRCGLPTRRTAKANIRKHTCVNSRASCKQMVTRGTMRFMKVDEWKKSHAWRMFVDPFTICTRRISLRWRKKRLSASRPYMSLRKRSGDVLLRPGQGDRTGPDESGGV